MNTPERLTPPSREALQRVRQLADRQLSLEEFEAYIHAPMSDDERQEIIDSAEWFMRRYPTPGERLAAVRRAHKQWVQASLALHHQS